MPLDCLNMYLVLCFALSKMSILHIPHKLRLERNCMPAAAMFLASANNFTRFKNFSHGISLHILSITIHNKIEHSLIFNFGCNGRPQTTAHRRIMPFVLVSQCSVGLTVLSQPLVYFIWFYFVLCFRLFAYTFSGQFFFWCDFVFCTRKCAAKKLFQFSGFCLRVSHLFAQIKYKIK